jgi:hypothetical protein
MGDQVVIVHMRTNRIYDLNPTAARLWDLLGAGHTVAEAQEEILREYDVEARQLAVEIEEAVTTMRQRDLLLPRDDD